MLPVSRMENFETLTVLIPAWLHRLDSVGGQVRQRQLMLARQHKPSTSAVPKKRRRPSTESLLALMAEAGAGADAKHTAGGPPVVYFDKEVTDLFSDLVSFVAEARRCLHRYGSPAWRSHLYCGVLGRLGTTRQPAPALQSRDEVLVADVAIEADDGTNNNDSAGIPLLPYFSTTRGMRGLGGGEKSDDDPPILAKMTSALAELQSAGETGASRFLRVGDCSLEVGRIRRALVMLMELAEQSTQESRESEMASWLGGGTVSVSQVLCC